MGTQVLRPQDCLINRIRLPQPAVFSRRRNGTSNSSTDHVSTSKPRPNNRKPAPRHDRKWSQSEPALSKRPSSDDLKSSAPERGGLVMEKVTILRRGESFDSKIRSSRSEASLRKEGERLGHEPGMVSRQTRIVGTGSTVGSADVLYAGSAFAVSPEPSSLPLPSFSKKKQMVGVVDDSATRDLRRLLRLD